MHIGTCVNLVRFLSHYFQFLKILVLHSLLSLTGSRVLIGVGNGVGYLNRVAYIRALLFGSDTSHMIGHWSAIRASGEVLRVIMGAWSQRMAHWKPATHVLALTMVNEEAFLFDN